MNLPGISDDLFIRDKVPMTKEEIRVLTMCKAKIRPDSIIWDIGAGTGSLSIEAAMLAPQGRVYAVEKKVIRESPCKGIKVASTNDILSKDILSRDELQKLFATHYEKESETIRRAFALTCFTGIRYCDVKRLTYKNIDYSNKLLTFRQSKVKHDSSVSGVPIPLNDMLLAVIGEKPKGVRDTDLVFEDLPSLEACLKALKHWTKRAGIDKRITWHL